MLTDISELNHKFCSACTCIYSNSHNPNELLQLQLQESYSLPILTYCTAAVKLSDTNLNHLNACWNSVYRRLFGFHRWESVRSCINGLSRLNFHHIRLVLMAKFYKSLSHTESVRLKSMYEQQMRVGSNYESLGKFLEVDFSLPFFVLKSKIVSKFNLSCG